MQAVEGGTLDTDYRTSIVARETPYDNVTRGAFRYGSVEHDSHADFDLSLARITTWGQGGAGGSYTVRADDTLASVAAMLWGDAALWYKLAEANGLSAQGALSEGQVLRLSASVQKNTHNASTFKPYDPSQVLGETSPTTPQPQKNSNKCGAFGAILLTVISIAVSLVLPVAAPGVFGGLLGQIGAAVIGNVVSQGVGLATGIQDKFNWKSVAMTAISAGVGAGLGKVMGSTAIGGSKLLTDAVRGAAGSAITQGIGWPPGYRRSSIGPPLQRRGSEPLWVERSAVS